MAFQSFPMEFQVNKITSDEYEVLFSQGDYFSNFYLFSPICLVECIGQAAEKRILEKREQKDIDKLLLISVKNFEVRSNPDEIHHCIDRAMFHFDELVQFGDYITTSVTVKDRERIICKCSLVHFVERV